jgi:hypothetical protein
MRKAFPIHWFIVSLCLLCRAAAQQIDAPSPATAADTIDHIRRSLFAFSSIEYRYEWQRVGVARGAASNQSLYGNSGEFAYADGKFFSDYLVTIEKDVHHGVAAFDGELYQSMSDLHGAGRLTVSSGLDTLRPYVAVQPIMMPCASFLGYDADRGLRFDIDCHRAPAIWMPMQESAMLAASVTIRGHRCAVVKFTHGKSNPTTDVTLFVALDLNHYPIRVVGQRGEGERKRSHTIDVLEVRDLNTPAGRIIVPLRIETIGEDAVGTKLSTEIATIDPDSLKVNQPIPAERFYLKRLMPLSITFASNVTPQQQAHYEQGPRE